MWLLGASDLAVQHAVWDLLYRLGHRQFFPGPAWEVIPAQDPLAIHETELFNPATEGWQPAAAMQVDRLYHSSAILLPDGRVMAVGSNPAAAQVAGSPPGRV